MFWVDALRLVAASHCPERHKCRYNPHAHAKYTIQGGSSHRSGRAPVDVAVSDPDAADHDFFRYKTLHLVVLAVNDALDLDASDDPLPILVVITVTALILTLVLNIVVRAGLLGVSGMMLCDRRNLEPDTEKVVDIA